MRPVGAALLVVDDDAEVRAHHERFLRAAFPDAAVCTAQDGQLGIEVMEKHTFDLVLSDQRMPRMQGIEFLAHVAERWPATQRVLLTAFADIDVALRAVDEGHVHAFLRKPVHHQELRAVVADLVDQHRRRARVREDLARSVQRLQRIIERKRRVPP